LESGANTTQPSAPLTGQLWFDKSGGLLKVYNGSQFKNLGSATASASAPSGVVTGDYGLIQQMHNLKCMTAVRSF